MIVLEPRQWHDDIKQRLIKEYGAKIMISYVCRRELGFTVREHKGWVDNPRYRDELAQHNEQHRLLNEAITEKKKFDDLSIDWLMVSEPRKGHSVHQVCLDFFNEAQETYFRLKYL
jgi:hypothetical protein